MSDFSRQLPKIFSFSIADHCNQQTTVCLRGNSHMHLSEAMDYALFTIKMSIDSRVVGKTFRHGPDNKWQNRETGTCAFHAVEFSPQSFECGHIHFFYI